MKKIYVVYESWYDDAYENGCYGDDVMSIFDSEEKAVNFIMNYVTDEIISDHHRLRESKLVPLSSIPETIKEKESIGLELDKDDDLTQECLIFYRQYYYESELVF